MSTVRAGRAGGSFSLAMVLTLFGAGCGGGESPAPEPHPVIDKEWRTVIADWYGDGDFDHSHRCHAVREASRHLPSRSPDMQTLHADLRALEARACSTP